jgi:hypothetical protein
MKDESTSFVARMWQLHATSRVRCRHKHWFNGCPYIVRYGTIESRNTEGVEGYKITRLPPHHNTFAHSWAVYFVASLKKFHEDSRLSMTAGREPISRRAKLNCCKPVGRSTLSATGRWPMATQLSVDAWTTDIYRQLFISCYTTSCAASAQRIRPQVETTDGFRSTTARVRHPLQRMEFG